MEEGGLSATVNVETLKPLSLGERSFVVSAKAIQEENSGETTPYLSALYNDTFADDSVGVSFGVHFDEREVESHFYEAFGLINWPEAWNGQDYNFDGDTDDTFRYDAATGFAMFKEERKRTTLFNTLQWRPTDDLDLSLETLYSKFETDGIKPLNSFRWVNIAGGAGVTGSSIVADPLGGSDGYTNRLQVDGVDLRNSTRHNDEKDELLSVSLSGEYTLSDNLLTKAELSYAKSERETTALALNVIGRPHAFFQYREDLSAIADHGFVEGGPDPLAPELFNSVGVNGDYKKPTEDENIDFRLDFDYYTDYELSDNLTITNVEFGIKLSQKEKFLGHQFINIGSQENIEKFAELLGETYDPNSVEGGSFSAANYMTLHSPSNYLDGFGNGQFVTSWLSADMDKVLSKVSAEQLAAIQLDVGGPGQIEVKENVTAAYFKVNFDGMDTKLRGNFGVRVVQTKQESAGNIPDLSTIRFDGGGVTSVDSSESSMTRDYTEVLPSLNIAYDVTDDVIVRFAAARVMSRPTLQVLSPATQINANVQSINSSNPNVDPFIADQIDLSFEWYFAEAGMVSFAPFMKSIDSFIVNSRKDEQHTVTDLDGNNPRTLNFSRFAPDNGRGSDMYGFELNWLQPLDEIIEGFGFTANFTFVDADDIQLDESGPLLPLEGLSRTSYNLVAYYETETFGARFAYNYRDQFTTQEMNYFNDGRYIKSYSQLDFSASYDISEDSSVIFEVLNLTDEVTVETNSIGINRGVEDVGKRFTLGFRTKF
ncbi:TonB-dependent receptor [Pseudoalteromonas phenolica O-BC30]|nr:TonB-dependent receptor [Pseudoalteromonas phenolica O-BC30]